MSGVSITNARVGGLFPVSCILLAMPPGLQAQAPGLLTKGQVSECQFGNFEQPSQPESLSQAWHQIWGRLPVVDEDALILQPTESPTVWTVLINKRAEGRYVDRGTFIEESRYAYDREMARGGRELTGVPPTMDWQHYVAAGTMTSSTGVAAPVMGLVSEWDDGQGLAKRSFGILGLANDIPDVMAAAVQVANLLDSRGRYEDLASTEAFQEKSQPPTRLGCLRDCFLEELDRQATCELDFTFCVLPFVPGHDACLDRCANADPANGTQECTEGCDDDFSRQSLQCYLDDSECGRTSVHFYEDCKLTCPAH